MCDKLSNHLWYLSETNVGLAFFDSKIDHKTKKGMVRRLAPLAYVGTSENLIRVKKFKKRYDLESYVSNRTLDFFRIMKIKTSFLFQSPKDCNMNVDFQEGKILCENLNVTNDCAERAISIASTYNNVGPLGNQEKSNMIIQTAHNRREQNNSNKKTSCYLY